MYSFFFSYNVYHWTLNSWLEFLKHYKEFIILLFLQHQQERRKKSVRVSEWVRENRNTSLRYLENMFTSYNQLFYDSTRLSEQCVIMPFHTNNGCAFNFSTLLPPYSATSIMKNIFSRTFVGYKRGKRCHLRDCLGEFKSTIFPPSTFYSLLPFVISRRSWVFCIK